MALFIELLSKSGQTRKRMTNLIEKIGRFFAEQEAQIQETFRHVSYAPLSTILPSTAKPLRSLHRVSTPEFGRGSLAATSRPTLPWRNNSIDRQRSSSRSRLESKPTTPSQRWQDGINEVLDAVQPCSSNRDGSVKPSDPMSLSSPISSHDDIKASQYRDELVSRRLSALSSCSGSSIVPSRKHGSRASQTSSDSHDRQQKPRQKRRKRKQKRSDNQTDEQPDPIIVAKANAEKVSVALALAQERAKQIQHAKLQRERDQEVERQAAALRLQEQMVKIEAVRAKSFRLRQPSTITTARSSSSYCESDNQNDENSSTFMIELEAHLREKMSLSMHVKQSYLKKSKHRDRISFKLYEIGHQNALQKAKVARLSAMKASLEAELTAVLEEVGQTRQRRRELEHADERERVKRQREAERTLHIRLREEEWRNMMKEEKGRSAIAAEARAKASKRVEAHSANLRRAMEAYRYELRSSSSSTLPSARSSNSDKEQNSHDLVVPGRRAETIAIGHCDGE